MNALLVSYQFPPTGGAGVQRALKLAKFLPEFGITPAVMTPANPSVPLTDRSMLADVAETLEVIRPRTLEPGYAVKAAVWKQDAGGPPSGWLARAKAAVVRVAKGALVPDPQILWQPAAQVALARRLARGRDDALWISGPPFSQFLLAPLARARGTVGIVLDYRDEWTTLRTAYEMSNTAAQRASEQLESAVLRAAHAVTTATPAFREALLDRHRFLDPGRVHAISNGYDPDDFTGDLPEPPSDRFVITYAGTIFSLTSPRGFLAALEILARDEPELARLLDVRFIGRIVETEAARFEGTEAVGVSRLGYLPKSEVTRALAESHLTLCLLDDLDVCGRIYPAKIFELMHLGRPVLTLAPSGSLADLVRDHRLGPCLPPRDAPAIAAFLANAVGDFRAGRYDNRAHSVDIAQFHRRSLASDTADVLRQAVSCARRRGAPR